MPSIVLRIDNYDEGNELASLADTLRGYDQLRGRIDIIPTTPNTNEMGAAVDALAIALAPGGAATILATGIALWLRHRRPGRRSKLGLRLEFPNGSQLTVDADGIEDVEAVVAASLKPWTTEQ